MNDALLEELLNEDESAYLDFKRDQYRFSGTSDEEKSELLKDVLAFANAFRRATAYILIGIDEVKGGRSIVIGVTEHLNDASLQEFVNKKLQRPLTFSYEAFAFEGKQIGIIDIPLQERPFYLKKSFGRLKDNVVYLRRSSSTDVASPDEIAKMGIVSDGDINSQIELKILLEELQRNHQKLTSGFDIYLARMKFVHQQYSRLFEKGIINRLSSDLRVPLSIAYEQIRELDRLITMAWDSGGRNNKWAENLNEARPMISGTAIAVATALDKLTKYLNSFQQI